MSGEGSAIGLAHLVGVAVVGSQQNLTTGGQNRVDDLAGAGVHSLNGLHSGLEDAGVTDHVAVGEVQDDHVVLAALDALDALVGNLEGAHLGLQVVGGNLGAGDQGAILALEGSLHAAVEEEGHMGVLLGLGDAQLGLAALGQVLAHHVGQALGLEGNLHVGHGGVVLGEADVVHGKAAVLALEAVEGVVHEGAGDLTGTVGAEVEEDHGVALGYAAALAGHGGYHELVGHALGVAVGHHLSGGALHAFAVYEGSVGLLHAIPAVVAVHGVVTAGDGSDLAHAQLVQLCLQLVDVALAGIGGNVTAVHDGMNVNFLGAHILGHVQQAEQVLDVAVHAAGRQQAHQVDGLAVLDGSLHGVHNGLVGADGTVLNGLGDAGQLLVHDAAGADVGVTNLAVAHLAVGQAHVHAGSTDGGVGAGGEQLVQIGGFGGHDGVALGLVGHPAEAVQNAEHQGFLRHNGLLLND